MFIIILYIPWSLSTLKFPCNVNTGIFPKVKKTQYDFASVLRLSVWLFHIHFSSTGLATGSFFYILLHPISLTVKPSASIRLSFLHFGQNSGKCKSTVSFRNLTLVLFPHTGQYTHFWYSISSLFIFFTLSRYFLEYFGNFLYMLLYLFHYFLFILCSIINAV